MNIADINFDNISQKDRQVLFFKLMDMQLGGPVILPDVEGIGVLPFGSDEMIQPDHIVSICRPSFRCMKPQKLIILEPTIYVSDFKLPRSAWNVVSVFVGACAQFESMGTINGSAFDGSNALDWAWTTIEPGITVTLSVKHDLQYPVPFRALLFGKVLEKMHKRETNMFPATTFEDVVKDIA